MLWLLLYGIRLLYDTFLDVVSYCCFLGRGQVPLRGCRDVSDDEEYWEDSVQDFEQVEYRPRVEAKREFVGLEDDKSEDECWREYFASPADWWDNQQGKRNPKSLDFKYKISRKAYGSTGGIPRSG
jgi:hypothetical protein